MDLSGSFHMGLGTGDGQRSGCPAGDQKADRRHAAGIGGCAGDPLVQGDVGAEIALFTLCFE